MQAVNPASSANGACTPNARRCQDCQQRGEAAARALAAVLKHDDMGVSAAMVDALLAGGKCLCQLKPSSFYNLSSMH